MYNNCTYNLLFVQYFSCIFSLIKLKEQEIGLFLIYCENDKKSNALLNPDLEFQLIDFLITKNEEFKKFTIFEK